MEQSKKLIMESGFKIVEEVPYVYGERFYFWNLLVKVMRKVKPRALFKKYITSKYSFTLRR
jgi:hypothetical protein